MRLSMHQTDNLNTAIEMVDIYTDGACSGNPGPGGWGAIIIFSHTTHEIMGGEANTTNNRMELRAAIEGLSALKQPSCARIYTDSVYVRDGITKWIYRWKINNWLTSRRKPVKNIDLWKCLDHALQNHEVKWHWIKGHSGHPQNERADQLARDGMLVHRG